MATVLLNGTFLNFTPVVFPLIEPHQDIATSQHNDTRHHYQTASTYIFEPSKRGQNSELASEGFDEETPGSAATKNLSSSEDLRLAPVEGPFVAYEDNDINTQTVSLSPPAIPLSKEFLDLSENHLFEELPDEHQPITITLHRDHVFNELNELSSQGITQMYHSFRIEMEIAHKELIQEPAYVADCWGPILREHLGKFGESLEAILKSLEPSSKNVLEILQFEEFKNPSEAATAFFLKKFTRNSTDERRKFLSFCTGADVLLVPAIDVKLFEPTNDFSRMPVAHTCGCLLEVPSSYGSVAEFSEEMSGILNSNIWVMDVI
ncbi:hypothetical protein CAPTEDRAFT_205533 [Capitella teleta]|uniref:HECT domain-containing protein n=1 Tax=Capitella teleta TaxID=283909 RepID=R7VLP7_CAPTE|nr:hypothetical protein CAPTEDRAFT_205533 [Capitella teleta]|eukprot:ELU18471.1 hypothetical protein CAPTEDRAFT_205533 [Capitella teleta]